jgi:hypothetical protein
MFQCIDNEYSALVRQVLYLLLQFPEFIFIRFVNFCKLTDYPCLCVLSELHSEYLTHTTGLQQHSNNSSKAYLT